MVTRGELLYYVSYKSARGATQEMSYRTYGRASEKHRKRTTFVHSGTEHVSIKETQNK